MGRSALAVPPVSRPSKDRLGVSKAMPSADVSRLQVFVVVAERGSFAKAATVLGLSNSTVSHTIRTLEESLGVRLLNRTTRSVALTEARDRLFARVQPALDELDAAVEDLSAFRANPAGPLRLTVSSLGLAMVVAPVLRSFLEAYPDITLDIAVNDENADLVDARVHAGICGRRRIPQDMIATRIGEPSRQVALASPEYLARCGRPRTPDDLRKHNCVQFRLANGALYRWDFEREGVKFAAPITGSLITDSVDLMIRAAVDGVGIGCTVEAYAASLIASGKLVVVLEDYAPVFPGWFIYHPSRRQIPLPLRAFKAFLTGVPDPEIEAVNPRAGLRLLESRAG